jgi:hypothetical protein
MLMGIGTGKPEFPPLLSAGFHHLGVRALRTLCVASFPLSSTRAPIMAGLEEVRRHLISVDLRGQLWIDGSFMTQKIDPDDVDVVLHINADEYNNGNTETRAAIEWVNSNLEASHRVHSFVLFRYPKNNPMHASSVWDNAYWIKQFGFSRADSHKGMAILRLS